METGFTKIYRGITHGDKFKDLNVYEVIIYCQLISYHVAGGIVSPSTDELAKIGRCSKGTVSKVIKHLEELNLIKVKRFTKKRSIYQIVEFDGFKEMTKSRTKKSSSSENHNYEYVESPDNNKYESIPF